MAKELGALGLLGMHLDGYGCAGRQRGRLRAGLHGARGRRRGRPQLRLGPGLAGHVPDLALRAPRSRSSSWLPAHGRRRGHRLLRPDRARLRAPTRLDADARAARRLGLDPQRHQDVDHQRRLADVAVVWARDRRRTDPRLPRPDRHPGLPANDIHKKISLRASVTSELVLDGRPRCPTSAVFPEVRALRGPLSCLNEARFGIVWGAVGAGPRLLRVGARLRRRTRPVRQADRLFQLTQQKLVEMAARGEPAGLSWPCTSAA